MNDAQKLRELVGNIIERTLQGEIPWARRGANFETHIAGVKLTLMPNRSLLGALKGGLMGGAAGGVGPELHVQDPAQKTELSILEQDLLGTTQPLAQLANGGLLAELMRIITNSQDPSQQVINKLLQATKKPS